MTKINPRKLPPSLISQFQSDLWKAIASLETQEEVKEFFIDLTTHTEMKMMAKRFRVAVRLLEGKSYAKIMKEVMVSEGLISSVHNLLQTGAVTLEAKAGDFVKEDRDSEIATQLLESDEAPRTGHYMAGDLLLPVLDETSRLLKRKIREKKRGY